MKNIIIVSIIIMGLGWANQTRMNTLLAGDYIDDPVNISVFPQHIALFQNTLYGDIIHGLEDFGIIVAVKPEFGGLAIWENNNVNIGYGLTLRRFDIGFFASPVKDNMKFGFGLGRAFFASRCDLSLIMSDADQNQYLKVNLRCLKRKTDYILEPRYTFGLYQAPQEYQTHQIGFMLQRLILNEGFVFVIGNYLLSTLDTQPDAVNVDAGFELPLNRVFILRLGCTEQFGIDSGLTPSGLQVEPGIGLRIREFNLDFHLNKERLFNKDLTFVNSFGLDLNFGKF